MFTKEMKRALEADGEKLRQLTGEDHGPEFWITCEACCGEGSIEKPHPFPDDPYYCDVIKCDTCNGVGLVLED
jgi:hypothetical protein